MISTSASRPARDADEADREMVWYGLCIMQPSWHATEICRCTVAAPGLWSNYALCNKWVPPVLCAAVHKDSLVIQPMHSGKRSQSVKAAATQVEDYIGDLHSRGISVN
jgi:hypothetical protein